MKTKKHDDGTENIDNETETSVEGIDTPQDKEDAQLKRLAASIRKILGGRKARRHLVPEVPSHDDETAENAEAEERPVEWMMRLMH